MNRRDFLAGTAITGFGLANGLDAKAFGKERVLDRESIVKRHNPRLIAPDLMSPMQVGNGQLGFGADITGLQTFPDEYSKQTALSTLSEWGWHSFPNPEHYQLGEDWKLFNSHGRQVPYLDAAGDMFPSQAPARVQAAAKWLIANPHRILLARIGLILPNGKKLELDSLSKIDQTLDLWTGVLLSRFELSGEMVEVTTVCHSEQGSLGVRIRSRLLDGQRLGLFIGVPYASGGWDIPGDWSAAAADKYETLLESHALYSVIACTLDATRYNIAIRQNVPADWKQTPRHHFTSFVPEGSEWQMTFTFSPNPISSPPPDFADAYRSSVNGWRQFWLSGGAIDFSESSDPRAEELERRAVLSQYLTKVNSSGKMPPQETGFVSDSWFGKFHLEMYWWHAMHFVLWNRSELFERVMPWYFSILPAARQTAIKQGYTGVRWPKEVGPDGRETLSDIGVFLIWQQPHPIYYSEMLYQQMPDHKTLEKYKVLVFETAEFMASYASWNEKTQQYDLGPPLIGAEEEQIRDKEQITNPTFELTYWRWGLTTAQVWRERLGLQRHPDWDRVIRNLAPPTIRDGVYAEIAIPRYITRAGHPSMLGALGMLPATSHIDKEVMRRTLKSVLGDWNWDSTWGWDFPLMAMTAARLGEPELAVDALLMPVPKNRYLLNGHNFQIPVQLPAYLPGNGGTLSAVAMMAAGWRSGSGYSNPGFPGNGKWHVKWENLRRAL